MMRLVTLVALLGLVWLTACGALDDLAPPDGAGMATAVPALASVTPAGAAVNAALPTLPRRTVTAVVATAPGQPTAQLPTALPGIQPTATRATGFFELRFALSPEAAPQISFARGSEEVFALWDYVGMQAGDRVRRIWFLNDQIWHVREETWDVASYGSAGTVRDISVFDFEGTGLEPAAYRLQIYVNEELHVEAGFVVE